MDVDLVDVSGGGRGDGDGGGGGGGGGGSGGGGTVDKKVAVTVKVKEEAVEERTLHAKFRRFSAFYTTFGTTSCCYKIVSRQFRELCHQHVIASNKRKQWSI
jgi:hypothetical protein